MGNRILRARKTTFKVKRQSVGKMRVGFFRSNRWVYIIFFKDVEEMRHMVVYSQKYSLKTPVPEIVSGICSTLRENGVSRVVFDRRGYSAKVGLVSDIIRGCQNYM